MGKITSRTHLVESILRFRKTVENIFIYLVKNGFKSFKNSKVKVEDCSLKGSGSHFSQAKVVCKHTSSMKEREVKEGREIMSLIK